MSTWKRWFYSQELHKCFTVSRASNVFLMKSMTAWRRMTCCHFLPFFIGDCVREEKQRVCKLRGHSIWYRRAAILCRWCVFEPKSAAVETEKWRLGNDPLVQDLPNHCSAFGNSLEHLFISYFLSSPAFYSVDPNTRWIQVRQWNRCTKAKLPECSAAHV